MSGTPYHLQPEMTKDSYWGRILAKKILVYVVCILITIMCILPFIIMFVSSTKSRLEINGAMLDWLELDNSFICSVIPSRHFWDNWDFLFNNQSISLPIMGGFLNSLIVTVGSTLLTVYFSALTAYGFHVYRFKGNSTLYKFILLVMMVPTQVSAIGFIEFVAKLGWNDTYWPLILPAIAAPSTVFFLRQYMQSGLSLELVEAGRMDGCTEFGIFNKLVLPILTPGMATMGIFAMVGAWNNFFIPSMVLNSKEKYTIPLLVSLLSSNKYQTQYGAIYLGLSLTTLPLIVFYLLLSKYIIAGVALGGVKE